MSRFGLTRGVLAAIAQRWTSLWQRTTKRADAARFDHILTMLERDARLKGRMLDELREAERLGKGAALKRSSEVDLAELIQSTTASLRPLAAAENVTLNARCAATSVVIAADAADLSHVVSRLLACAIASSRRGGTIDCELSVSADWIRLLVRNEGAGADAEQPGLSTVRTLVELHGGTLRVEGKGPHSLFTVSLPGGRVLPESASDTSFDYPEGQ